MDISNLVQIFATKLDSDFRNLEVSVLDVLTEKVIFDGNVGNFVRDVYAGKLDGTFTVCEILRRANEEAINTPIYNRPFIITVV